MDFRLRHREVVSRMCALIDELKWKNVLTVNEHIHYLCSLPTLDHTNDLNIRVKI
jgi:hypothetical protein